MCSLPPQRCTYIYIYFKQTVLQEIQMLAPECLYTPFIPKCQERVHCFKHFGARTSAALGKSPFEGLWHHNLTSKIVSWEQCLPGSLLHFSRDNPLVAQHVFTAVQSARLTPLTGFILHIKQSNLNINILNSIFNILT